MASNHYVIKHPFTHQLLTLNPGRFMSLEDLKTSIGHEFIHDGMTLHADECDVEEVPAKISEMCRSEASGHNKSCLCVCCRERKKERA